MLNIEKSFNFHDGDTIVVGCSTGPDSMALLYLLMEIRKSTAIKIVCAHVNHNLRKESADEYVFLENTAQLSGDPPVTYDDLSVPQNARATSGTTGAINYMDITGSNTDNVWLDSTLSTVSYDELLYNKFVNLFLKVILNQDNTETVTCEISIASKGV